MKRHYTPRDIELSRKIYSALVAGLQSAVPKFQTYGEIGDKTEVFHRTVRGAFYLIQDRCRERDWPNLTVWVIRKDSGFPGQGCDAVALEQVRETAEVTHTIEWSTEAWW